MNFNMCCGLCRLYEFKAHVSGSLNQSDLIGRRSLIFFITVLVFLNNNLMSNRQCSQVFIPKGLFAVKFNNILFLSVLYKYFLYRVVPTIWCSYQFLEILITKSFGRLRGLVSIFVDES